MSGADRERRMHTSHWGAFQAEVEAGTVVAVHPWRDDPDPSPLLENIPGSLRHRARIAQPMIRAGWLDRGPGPDGRRGSVRGYLDRATAWSVIERHTELFVCFGGLPLKNTMVTPGGASRHPTRGHLHAAKARGTEFVLLSPLRDDLPEFVGAEWLPVVPGADVAGMLALASTLVEER